MNKKKIALTACATALVGTLAVGGTLAYFTAQTNTVENVFTGNNKDLKGIIDENFNKKIAEIREFIDKFAEDNEKVAKLLEKILAEIEEDHKAYAGRNISEILDRMRHEAVEEILGKFSEEWFCNKDIVIYSAYHYNGELSSIPSSVKETSDYKKYCESTENPWPKYKYRNELAKALKEVLDKEIVPLLR